MEIISSIAKSRKDAIIINPFSIFVPFADQVNGTMHKLGVGGWRFEAEKRNNLLGVIFASNL
jgi:hypothetical protein